MKFFKKNENKTFFLIHLTKQPVLKLIRLYQKTLSPDHGPFSILHPWGYCRFKPTCSEYSYQAIDKYGIIKGGLKALWRIMRCHPWSKGGYDPVDKPKDKNLKNTKK